MVKAPADWDECSLSDLFGVLAGGDLKKSLFSPYRTQAYTYKIFSNAIENYGLYGYTSKPCYPADSITVTARGTIGKAYYRDEPFDAIIRLLVLVPKNKNICTKFYVYYINHMVTFDLESTGVPQLTVPKIGEKKVPLFSKSEQQAIADTLSIFDTYISDITELIEKKRAIRDGALEDLVSGKKRLDGFDGEWKEVHFKDVITPKARIGWQGLKKHEYLRSGYSYLIGGTDFSQGTVSLEHISFVTKERYQMDTNIQVGENDVLVTKDGTIGKVAIVPKLLKPATLNSGVFIFRTTADLLPVYLYRVLISSTFSHFIALLSAGSTIKHLYQKDLKRFEFRIPTAIKEQQAIADTLTAMDDEIRELEEERSKMKEIREGAMDDLLTGRVRLPL